MKSGQELLVSMTESELALVLSGLLELHRAEMVKARRVYKRMKQGKRTRTRPSEHAMYMADIAALSLRLRNDERTLK